MIQRTRMTNYVAAALIVSMQALALPASAGAAPASLSGALVRAADQSPVVGAKLHVGNPETGAILTTAPADDKGSFTIGGLAPATYQLAVETDGGLYVVTTPVHLAPGQSRTVNVAVASATQQDDDDDQPGAAAAPAKTSMWENPLTAALIVLGAAIVVGFVVDEATDDDDESDASPS
jgi:Carboxypeptidase regulatory-like domain